MKAQPLYMYMYVFALYTCACALCYAECVLIDCAQHLPDTTDCAQHLPNAYATPTECILIVYDTYRMHTDCV